LLALLQAPGRVAAQGGPPFLTNDPGTPGNANWEINIGSMQTLTRNAASYELPQLDLNFGVGDRIQLTYEIPYVLQANAGARDQSGWSNAYPGLKWRFLDQGEEGWQASIFPQVEAGTSGAARDKGIAVPGPRYLLPIEVTHKLGPLDVDFEAGYYVGGRGQRERILGLAVGRSVTERLELDAEIYDDRAAGASPRSTTLDLGGRYKLSGSFIALFMAGRSVAGFAAQQPEFLGYVGIQVLLSNYGLSLNTAP